MSRKGIDLTGQKFGDLEVVSRSEKTDNKRNIFWDCKCKCGESKTYRGDVLRKRGITHCGCGNLNVKVGDKVGKLTVVGRDEQTRRTLY